MRRKSEQLKSILRSPIGLIGVVVLGILMVLVVLSIIKLFSNNNDSNEVPSLNYEYDPASQTKIIDYPITNGDYVELPIYVGFTEVLNNGMTGLQMNVMKDAIRQYSESISLDLTRVSYLKGSYSLGGLYVFDFVVVLNVNEIPLKVRVDSSKGLKDIVGMKVILWGKDGEEVYSFEVNEDNKCDYLDEC